MGCCPSSVGTLAPRTFSAVFMHNTTSSACPWVLYFQCRRECRTGSKRSVGRPLPTFQDDPKVLYFQCRAGTRANQNTVAMRHGGLPSGSDGCTDVVQAGRFGGKKEGLKEDTHRLPSVVLPVSTTPHSDVSDRYGVTMRLDPGGAAPRLSKDGANAAYLPKRILWRAPRRSTARRCAHSLHHHGDPFCMLSRSAT